MSDYVKLQSGTNFSNPTIGQNREQRITPNTGGPEAYYVDEGDFGSGMRMRRKERVEHMSQATLNQQAQDYTLQQMAYSAKLQEEAERRAQEYNDPAAVAARAAAAGFSPEAALGSGGAYQMGTSSAPGAPGASPGSGAHGSSVISDIAPLIGSVASMVTAGSGAALSGAQKILTEAQTKGALIKNVQEGLQTQFLPFMLSAGLQEKEANALSAWISSQINLGLFNTTLSDGTPLWKQDGINKIVNGILENNNIAADTRKKIAEGLEAFMNGYNSFTSAEDLIATRDSRINKNTADARDANASAEGKELRNTDYSKYGITPEQTVKGVPLTPIARWFEEFEKATLNQAGDGFGQLLTNIITNIPGKVVGDVKGIANYLLNTWKNTFGKYITIENAFKLAKQIAPAFENSVN